MQLIGLHGCLQHHLVRKLEFLGDLGRILDQTKAHALIKGLNRCLPDQILGKAIFLGIIGSSPVKFAVDFSIE